MSSSVDRWLFQREWGLCQYKGTNVTGERMPWRRWSSKAVTHIAELPEGSGSHVVCISVGLCGQEAGRPHARPFALQWLCDVGQFSFPFLSSLSQL